MFRNLFKKDNTRDSNNDHNVETIAKEELRENFDVIKSLKDYDQGKKEISTSEVRRHMHNISAS